eukprot:gene2721-3147_t
MALLFDEETLAFTEEVHKYDCLYNKFNKHFKNKFVKYNCWIKVADKFNLKPEEAEKKFKNIRSAFGRHLRKQKSVPSGSGREAVPADIPGSLQWLSNVIVHRQTSTNFISQGVNMTPEKELDKDERQEQSDESDKDFGDDEKISAMAENEDQPSEEFDTTNTMMPIEDEEDANLGKETSGSNGEQPAKKKKSNNAASNDIHPTAAKRKFSRQVKPWAGEKGKPTKQEIDFALIKTAQNVAETAKALKTDKTSNTSIPEDDVTLYCRSLIKRMKDLPKHARSFVRCQIEQTMFQAECNVAQQLPPQGRMMHHNVASYASTQETFSQLPNSQTSYRRLLQQSESPSFASSEDSFTEI